MPMSLELTAASATLVGQSVRQGLLPALNTISSQLARIDNNVGFFTDLFRPLGDQIATSIQGIQYLGIRAYVINWHPVLRTMRELTTAYGMAVLSSLIRTGWRLGRINANLVSIEQTLVGVGDFLNGAIWATLHDILNTLQAILSQLQAGLLVSGDITLTINLGEGLSGLDLSGLAGQLLDLAGAAATLTASLTALTVAMLALSGALAVMSGAVALLSGALELLPDNLNEIVDTLKKLGLGIVALGAAIFILSPGKLIQIGLGFLGIATFLAFVGLALRLFNEQSLRVIPALDELFNSVSNLADRISDFEPEELMRIGAGFLGIAVFLGALGLALRLFNVETLEAVPGLQQLFDGLINLANAIVAFGPEQLVQIGLGFLGIAVFVGLLGLAMRAFTQEALMALPGLSQLIEAFNSLVGTLSQLGIGELITMGVAFALMAGFVLALSAAINRATPGLQALATILTQVDSMLGRVASAARSAASAIGSVIDRIPGLPSVGDIRNIIGFQEGGVMPYTGLAFLHEGERVLSVRESLALERGALSPTGPLIPTSLGGTAGPLGDQSINIEGGININISAERVDADSAELLSDEIVQRLMERLNALRAEQNFRTGVRTPLLA
jgi:hypothetical protein